MNEPKRRGRPPKAKLLQPVEPNARVEGDDCPEVGAWTVAGPLVLPVSEIACSKAQAYAMRVWNGQNTDLPRPERLERVRKALEGQGLSMEGVVL